MNENKSLTPPCKGCKTRYSLCHSACEPYKQYKSNMQVVSDAREDYKDRKNLYIESVTRAKRQ